MTNKTTDKDSIEKIFEQNGMIAIFSGETFL
jgi:hypothetical protein